MKKKICQNNNYKASCCHIYIVKKYSGNLHFIPQDAEINIPIFILDL